MGVIDEAIWTRVCLKDDGGCTFREWVIACNAEVVKHIQC